LIWEELENGLDKIVLFAWHRDVIEGLRQGLQAFSPVVITGETSPEDREKAEKRFKEDKTCRAIIGNIKAMGVAVDLSSACEVAFVEASASPGDNDQAAKRVWGLRQTRPCFARFFGLAGSIDDRLMEILKVKTETFSQVFT
jgi:SNF2 family DNA or RNA helicase